MKPRSSPFSIGLLALLALPACGTTDQNAGESGGGTNGDSGGSGDSTLFFLGPTDATPLSPELVAVAWLTATNSLEDSPETMSYILYRGDTENFEIGQASANDTHTLQGGPTGNPSLVVSVDFNATHFFKVVAQDSRGNSSESIRVVSAHTPDEYTSGELVYATDVAAMAWSVVENGGTNTCLTCHDGIDPPTNRLDLSTYTGLMNGIGDATAPDTFVVAGDGEATWGNFTARLSDIGLLTDHAPFLDSAPLLKLLLQPWADEGALEEPDTAPPFFDYVVGTEGLYTATPNWAAETVDIQFFHASDPESVLYGTSPTLNDQLEYRIYGGVDRNSIDWLTPLATLIFPTNGEFLLTDDSFEITLSWTENTGVFVVRAVDFIGNETVHDRELTIQR
jgi:hypothetical protein